MSLPNSSDSASSNHWQVIVSVVLNRIIASNKCNASLSSTLLSSPFACFHSSYPPSISLFEYVNRIMQFSNCSESCLILLMIYLDKLMSHKQLMLTDLNIHRLVITGLMVASKFHDDLFYNNAYYAKIGGVTLKEMNALETSFLNLMEYSLYVPVDLYNKYQTELTLSTSISLSSASTNMQNHLNYPMTPLANPPVPVSLLDLDTTPSNSLGFTPGPSPSVNMMVFNNNQYIPIEPVEEMKYVEPASSVHATSMHAPLYMVSPYEGLLGHTYTPSIGYDAGSKVSYNLMNSAFPPPPPPPQNLVCNNYLFPSSQKGFLTQPFLGLAGLYEETKHEWHPSSVSQVPSSLGQFSHSHLLSGSSSSSSNYNNNGWSVF